MPDEGVDASSSVVNAWSCFLLWCCTDVTNLLRKTSEMWNMKPQLFYIVAGDLLAVETLRVWKVRLGGK